MTDIADIKKKADEDLAWAKGRMQNYQDDGSPVPEPIRRVHALASLIVTYEPAIVAATPDTADLDKILGKRPDETTESAARRVARSQEHATRALLDSALLLQRTAQGIVDPATIATVEAQATAANEAPTGRVNVDRQAPADRKVIPLRDGLVLDGGQPRHRVRFYQRNGEWFCRATFRDEQEGAETGTRDGIWFSDTWTEVAPTLAEKIPTGGQQAMFGEQKTDPKPPADGKIRIGDWQPDEETLVRITGLLAKDLAAHSQTMAVTMAATRSLLGQYRAVKKDVEIANPAVAFRTWAKNVLEREATSK